MTKSEIAEARLRLQQLTNEIADKRQRWTAELLTWHSELSNQGDIVSDHPNVSKLHDLRDELSVLLDSLRSLKLPARAARTASAGKS